MSFSTTLRVICAATAMMVTIMGGAAAAIEDDRLIPPAELPQPGAPLNADELIQKYPADPRGHILAANSAMRKCDLAMAEREIRTAMAAAEKHPMFTENMRLRTNMRRMLASLYAMSQQHAKALAEENILVQGEPANTEYLYMRAQAHVQLKQLDQALDDVGKIIELDNTDFKAWQLRGFTEYRAKHFQQAIATFTIIAENTEDYPPIILAMRGQAHAASGTYDLAVADYDAAMALAQKQRAAGYSDEIVEQEIAAKKSNAEAARKAEAATPKDAPRIRAKLFDDDQHSLLPTNSLKCQ